MPDREKAIEGLEYLVTAYTFHGEDAQCIGDAIELLKEQEAVRPSVDVDTYVCPNCGHRLEHQGMLGDNVIFDERYNFCPACGKTVKWDD